MARLQTYVLQTQASRNEKTKVKVFLIAKMHVRFENFSHKKTRF